MKSSFTRRRFLSTASAAGLGLGFSAFSTPHARASANGRLRVLSIGTIGTIGGTDRLTIAGHPSAEITGLCDIDENALARSAEDHPNAFLCKDYRVAFDKHLDEFDAVIVAVPDHGHATMMLTAMAHDKHVYGQKPLVHQLEELEMIERALRAKPNLVTQMGNQRMAGAGRRRALEILRQGRLGKLIEVYAWVDSPSPGNAYFNYENILRELPEVPPHIDWDLWLGPAPEMPFHDALVPMKWRSWWEFGTNGLGDWGCHLLDIMFLAFDELRSPFSVTTESERPAGPLFHVSPVKATMKYQVESDHFASDVLPIHFYDRGVKPTAEEMRVGEVPEAGNATVIVGEKGTLAIDAQGQGHVWIDGEAIDTRRIDGMAEFPPLNHWHAWVDNCLGTPTELHAPFHLATRMTEASIIGVKASRFPNQELLWDRSNLTFTNHREATETLVRREYRAGFAPPSF